MDRHSRSPSDLPSWFGNDDPVPAVDPADLRAMWAMQRELQAKVSGQGVVTDIRLFERVCSPGANIEAVWYRVAMLHLLAGPVGLLSAWLRDGQPVEAVFQVAAIFPMKRMSVGVRQQGLPFDVQEFLAQVEKQDKQ